MVVFWPRCPMARRNQLWTVSVKRSVQFPLELLKTFTYDQGREMSKHAQLTERTGVAVYFCDPHRLWQRTE